MSVYIDPPIGCLVASNWRHTKSAHLMADSEDELLRFGRKIGCKPEWLQHSRTGVPHFDVTIRMRQTAILHGAIQVDREKVVDLMRRYTKEAPDARSRS